MTDEKLFAVRRFAELEERIDEVNEEFGRLDEQVISSFSKFQTELDGIEKHILEQMNTSRLTIVKSMSMNETNAMGRNKHLRVSIDRYHRRLDLSKGETHAPSLYNVMTMRLLVDLSASQVTSIHDRIFHFVIPQFFQFPLSESFWKTVFVSNSSYPITRSLSTLEAYNIIPVGDRLDWPFGIAVHPCTGLLYVADYGNHRVAVLNEDGTFLRAISKFANGQSFQNPNGIAFSKDGNFMVVTDHCANKVHLINGETEEIIVSIGKQGSDEGHFNEPRFVVFDNDDYFYVTDLRNSRIQKFNTKGAVVQVFSDQSTEKYLVSPMGIMLNDANELMIIPPGETSVRVYTLEGKFLRSIPVRKTTQYTFIARGPNGGFVISDYTEDQVNFYEADGTHIKSVSAPGAAGCVFDKSGRFFVLDRKNHQLFEF